MVACCAHHLADLLPLLGATGAATFLIDNRVAFMLVGIGVNAVAIGIAVRRLHRLPLSQRQTIPAIGRAGQRRAGQPREGDDPEGGHRPLHGP